MRKRIRKIEYTDLWIITDKEIIVDEGVEEWGEDEHPSNHMMLVQGYFTFIKSDNTAIDIGFTRSGEEFRYVHLRPNMNLSIYSHFYEFDNNDMSNHRYILEMLNIPLGNYQPTPETKLAEVDYKFLMDFGRDFKFDYDLFQKCLPTMNIKVSVNGKLTVLGNLLSMGE